MKQTPVLLCLLVGLLLLDAPALPQSGLGTVRGTVLDASGAAIPGATLVLTHQATGVERRSESTAVGLYVFTSVPIGSYTLTVEAPGFKKFSGTFTLQAGQTVVIDPRLEVGTVDTIIEVTGAAPVISTVGMEVGDVKDALRIQQLPLNGRFVANLFDLTPGVEGGGNPRVNGMKVGSADILLDGISFMDRFGGGLRPVQPGLDTVQEFRIETAGSSAQYSRPATMTLVTKSGTNELHGSLFWTHRNNFGGLRARQRQDFYTKPRSTSATSLAPRPAAPSFGTGPSGSPPTRGTASASPASPARRSRPRPSGQVISPPWWTRTTFPSPSTTR